MLGIPAEAEIDVMNDDNADSYCEHSDQFHMALDLTGGRAGLSALAKRCGAGSRICSASRSTSSRSPKCAMRRSPGMSGLDADGTRIGDALWNGEELDEAAGAVVGLFRLTFRDPRSCWTRSKASRSI